MIRLSGGFVLCSDGERREYIRFWVNRFGVPESVFDGLIFLRRGRNVWVFSGDSHILNELKYAASAGIKLLEIGKKGFKPTTAAIQVFGRYAVKNVVCLESFDDVLVFMTGGIIQRSFNVDKGFVIVRFGDDILGCGLYGASGLISQIPKHRRIEEKWYTKYGENET